MDTLKKLTSPRLGKKIYSRSIRAYKELYQLTQREKRCAKNILFIFGCQRSGTTLMTEIFEKDLDTKVYPEFSVLGSLIKDDRIRLKPLNIVQATIERDRFPVIVLKPLVESQNSVRILNYFPQAKALWMYRHYKDVASSNLNMFGIRNGINNLRYIVNKESQNWRAENVPDYIHKIVHKNFSEDMNPYDAAALFWFVRNSFFFDLGLDRFPKVMMCRYKDLVADPFQMHVKICHFIGHQHPKEKFTASVHTSSVGKGKSVIISPEIDSLCSNLLHRLDTIYDKARYSS